MKKILITASTVLLCVAAFLVGFFVREQFSDNSQAPIAHLPLYDKITSIKNRLTISITEPNFTNPVRICDFYELREEDSEDYFQTTVNYWVFQNGKETDGDIEAYVEIYNAPNRTDKYIVEVARSCWNELTVYLDGSVVTVFPTISSNALSQGYITFEVEG